MIYLYFLLSSFFGFQGIEQDPPIEAPNFEFTHENGNIQSLKNYKGQVVFISFWASWCKPCLVNFKEYEETRRVLQEMGVVLLNISLDKDKTQWETSLMQYGFLNGENGHANDIREIMNLYEMKFIPAYRIVNKNGMLEKLSQDENIDIVSEFQAWIEQASY